MKGLSPGYRPGDYWVVCDRCGEDKRISQTRPTWDNLIVCYPECWEPRHPQDFVYTKGDKQAVPIARPESITVLNSTTLSSGASKEDLTVDLTSVTSVSDGDSIGIVLDEGETQWVLVVGDPAVSTVTIFTALFGDAASGNTVYISTAKGDTFISSTSVSASDL